MMTPMADDDVLLPEHAAALAKVAREMLDEGDADALVRRYGKYRDDPAAFFREELGVTPWESEDPKQAGQGDVIRAVADNDRVAVKSGHKTSKSFTAAGLALWWVCTRTGARAILTAPTFEQVKGIIWRELHAFYRKKNLADKLGAELPLDPSTGLQLPNGNEIKGLSTKTKENLAGISAPNLFFIIDESSGFPDELFATILGNAAGGAKIFAISNPTRTSGWFFKIFFTQSDDWIRITLNSENTPNVRAKKKLIPGLAEHEWILLMRRLGGVNYLQDSEYMIRVRGEFPPQGVDAVISVQSVEDAKARWKDEKPAACEGVLTLGVDCARYGNDANVIAPVRGKYAYQITEVDTKSTRNSTELAAGKVLADEVIRVATVLRIGNERVRVNIDGIGVGASAVDFLKLCKPVQDGWMYVVDMNVGEKADETQELDAAGQFVMRTHYYNLRSQLWFGCADWLKTGAIPQHTQMQAELLAATYSFDKHVRRQVESKEKMRAVLGCSPDYADALCLAVYDGKRGTWTEFAYDAASDPRHPVAPAPVDPFAGFDDDDGGSGGSHSFL